jgi:heterodisulfide reductase subunit B
MLPVIYILKTNSQYVQKSVESHKTTCKNIQNTVKIVRCVQLSMGM